MLHFNILKYAPIILLLISLAGCATHPQPAAHVSSTGQAVETLSIQPCCVALKDIRSLPITPVGENFDFQLGPPDKPFASPQGRSYARVLTLPDDGKTYHFVIESYSSKVGGVRQIFAPIVMVLNNDYSISRTSNLQILRVGVENPIWKERERVTLFVKVDRDTKPKEKFVVITTDPEAYGNFFELLRIRTPNSPLYYVGRLTNEPSTEFLPDPIQVSPEGVLRITNLSSFMKKPFDHWILF